ncbi:MAG: fumarylacetoacetate hydrolase family protein [Synergistaceae bacterium]|jgi:2-keto-4-pentenoate hydratase/2-oxohepta-3-ene-1,7-dioic acid hydratase in catechol pathway|nr:fumarylacetoacetate hydrolase family protein [Synergistaceae bacterium]
MRLTTVVSGDAEVCALVARQGLIAVEDVNGELGVSWETDLFELIRRNKIPEMTGWFNDGGREEIESLKGCVLPFGEARYAPLYRGPRKIFGIGLNYADHAGDLFEDAPTGIPASFFKPATAIIGHGDEIKIPLQSRKTTAEAELGVIIGRDCSNIEREDWLDYVAGFTAIIDITAEDILRLNPRYLTHAKSFETFFSFGPHLVTPDEIPDVSALRVRTVLNGRVHAENVVANMTFPPDFLVAFHSKVFRWQPGDILSTGTPRAARIQRGDVAECRIDGFEPLKNPVADEGQHP